MSDEEEFFMDEEEFNKKKIENMSLKHSPLRMFVEGLYDVQKGRISLINMGHAYKKRMGLKDDNPVFMEVMQKVKEMKDIEKYMDRKIKKELKNYPAYTEGLKRIKGLGGPRVAGGIISWMEKFDKETKKVISIERFERISSLWQYAGIGEPGQKMRRGEKLNFNPRLKMHVLEKAGNSLIKSVEIKYDKKGEKIKIPRFYRQIFLNFKKKYREEHPEKIWNGRYSKKGKKIYDFSDGHIFLMARRAMCKILLSNFWIVWRKLEGLPVTKPYVLDKMGDKHKTYLYPPEWEEYFVGQ